MGLKRFAKNKTNPFMSEGLEAIQNNIVKKYKSATNTGEKAVLKAYDENTGEDLGHTTFIRQIKVDEEKFAKIYLNQFSAFYDLRKSSMQLIGYIMNHLIPNKDVFYLYIEDVIEELGLGKATIYRALEQLLDNKLIARGRSEEQFFINPMIIFNGNRVTFAQSYIKETANTDELPLLETGKEAFDSVLSKKHHQITIKEDIEKHKTPNSKR